MNLPGLLNIALLAIQIRRGTYDVLGPMIREGGVG